MTKILHNMYYENRNYVFKVTLPTSLIQNP